MILTNGVADHGFPDHRTQTTCIRMFVLYGRDNPQDMTYTNNNAAIVLNKRHLLCVSDAERLIRHNILVKVIKDRPMVFRLLNPGRFEAKGWFPFRLIIDTIFWRKIINIWMHQPCKRSRRERIRWINYLGGKEMPVCPWIVLLVWMHCILMELLV